MGVKVIAFEVDDTLWQNCLDDRHWGKGRYSRSPIEDNLECIDGRLVCDKSNRQNWIQLFEDVPKIIHNALKKGIKLAIVSANSNRELVNRALYHYAAKDASDWSKPIIFLVEYVEAGKGDGKIEAFKRIKGWSGAQYDEIIYFDCDRSSAIVHDQLGVQFMHVSRGLSWDIYFQAMEHGDPRNIPYYGLPVLGRRLGTGKFSTVYDSADDEHAIVKVLENWTTEMRYRFLEIYSIIKDGKPFDPGHTEIDQHLLMVSLELRNLTKLCQLKAPKPDDFTGWFSISKIEGVPLWNTRIYQSHPFSVPFQVLLRAGFHLAIDEIESSVKKYGVEHRDAHLSNIYFTMGANDQPMNAHLLDWGIAALMSWDGHQYLRGDDILAWSDSEAGHKYTPEEFRRYWIAWMVKTEYEANISRHALTEEDGRRFLEDINWWYQRPSI